MAYFEIFKNFIFILAIIIILFILLVYILYKYILSKFSQDYDNLFLVLKGIKNNNKNYMNFGYWDKDNIALSEANENLCRFVLNKADIKPGGEILDVGCGYGEQDFLWKESLENDIIGIDLSKKQIDFANSIKTQKNIQNLKFLTCDATNLPFEDKRFKNIICLESAFHYNPRCNFIKESYRVLDDESELIIADIVLKDNHSGFMKNLFILFFKQLFSVPNENLITIDQYENILTEHGFTVEKIDITTKTFKPYFDYFTKNNSMDFFIYNYFVKIINENIDDIPLSYYILKCKK